MAEEKKSDTKPATKRSAAAEHDPKAIPTHGMIAVKTLGVLKSIDASLKTIVAFLPKQPAMTIPGVTPPMEIAFPSAEELSKRKA